MASSLTNGGSPRNGAAKQAAHKVNLAARAGRWSAQHRKTAIWGWLGFMLLAVAIGSGVGIKTLDAHTPALASPGAPSSSRRRVPQVRGGDGPRPEPHPDG